MHAGLLIGLAAAQTTVTNVAELENAFATAREGDEVVLADGTYTLNDSLRTVAGGMAGARIVVRAQNPGGAIVESNGALAAFRIVDPYWTFDGLHVRVTGQSLRGFWMETNGQYVEIVNCRIEVGDESEAGIKASGSANAPQPDFARIENNEIWFPAPTNYLFAEGIDAVAVDGYVIRGNVIHGVRQATGGIGYGALTKGNSRNTIIENNLFYDNFIPISLGAGGTDPQFLRDQDTTFEDRDGIIRNNVTIRSDDVAVYLYAVRNAKVYNNTFVDSYATCDDGCSTIDVRLPGDADVRNNILDKIINDREGGTHTAASNVTLPSRDDTSWFVDAANLDFHLRPGTPPIDVGETLADVPTDFDGEARPMGAAVDVGADEVAAGPPPIGDAGVGVDAGTVPPDPTKDAGVGEEVLTPAVTGECGCRAAPRTPRSTGLSWLVLLLMVRRRR